MIIVFWNYVEKLFKLKISKIKKKNLNKGEII